MPSITTKPEVPAGKRRLEQVFDGLQPLLEPSEVAEYIRMTERSIWKLYESGALKGIKIGQKSLRIPLSALQAFIEERGVKA
jgi:excisionase family DNA binding protein